MSVALRPSNQLVTAQPAEVTYNTSIPMVHKRKEVHEPFFCHKKGGGGKAKQKGGRREDTGWKREGNPQQGAMAITLTLTSSPFHLPNPNFSIFLQSYHEP